MLDFNKIIYDSKESEWQRPKTTRRYLHPPKSERLFTLWAEGKIVMGENMLGVDHTSYPELWSSGIWIVHTRHGRQLDFRKTKNFINEHGAPIHRIENSFGGMLLDVEAFCDTNRKSTCFVKIKVQNTAPYQASEKFGLVLRSGHENKMIHGSPDEYVSYTPEVSEFKALAPTFKRDGNVFTDNDVFVNIKTDLDFEFDENEGIIWFKPSLSFDESASVILAFGKGEVNDFHYHFEKSKALGFWLRELSRINNLPSTLKNDEKTFEMIKNMVAQTLQCFCSYVGTSYTVLRQGGLQRLIWPWEAMPSIIALSRIGDFDDYIEEVLDFYFNIKQLPSGEIKPLGEGWAAITSSAIASAAYYCRQRNAVKCFEKYRDNILLAFDWICAKRKESDNDIDAVHGLFPPMRGSDWPQVFQNWCVTDAHAVIALSELIKTLEFFSDDALERVKAEYEDYVDCMLDVFNKIVDFDKASKTIRVPLTPNGDDKFFVESFYPYLFEATVVRALLDVLDPGVVDRLKARLVSTGLYKNGLYARMPYQNGDTHVWYTSISDFDWFDIYQKLGRREEALEIIKAQIKYSMTAEYYMIERYNDDDPYYVPWSPNVSAMGRLINMLMDYYG